MTKKKKSPTKKLFIVALVVVVVFILGAVLASSMGWFGGDEGQVVETTEAKLKTITQEVAASGKIQPVSEVIIRPEVSGEIVQLNVEEGDYVKENDIILRIKQDIYEARIEEIEAALLTQKARLQQAKANFLEAQYDFKKQKELYERDVSSEAQYMQAKTTFEAQKANYEAAKYQVQSVEAQLEQAKEELQKTIIRAPTSGTITKLAIEEGERVLGNARVAGTEMMSIADMNSMEVQVEVNENDIVNVSLSDTAKIQVNAYPERTFKGVVTEISNSAMVSAQGTTEQVTNYEVKIRVTTPHNLKMGPPDEMKKEPVREVADNIAAPNFKPGMSATVDIQTETVRQVVAIPIQAVTVRNFAEVETAADSAASDSAQAGGAIIPEEDLRKVVFIVEEGKAQRREVETGISDNTHIQIVSGVEAGEEIIIGSYRTLSKELEDGDDVKVDNSQFGTFTASS